MRVSPVAISALTMVLSVPVAVLSFVPAAFAQAKNAPAKNAPAKDAKKLAGIWSGKLTVPGATLTLIFSVKEKDGMLTSTLSVPEQNAKDMPVATTNFVSDTAILVMPNIGATFTGTFDKDGKLTGTFEQRGAKLPLTLTKTAKVPELERPQNPKAPFPYQTIDVSYDNMEAKGVKLAGTLTVPKGDGPFPVVLFITGSGQQDRDEGLMGHRPFAVIADYLARQGIASLRCDDRGIGGTTGDVASATSVDFASDARAGVNFLKTRKEVDTKKIGLIGHSEGGLIAPMVAAGNSDVAFVVLLAGPGVNGSEILLEQSTLINKAMGAPEDQIKLSNTLNSRVFGVMKQMADEKDTEKVKKAVQDAALEETEKLPEAQKTPIRAALQKQIGTLTSPWFRYFLTYEPSTNLSKLTCPVLAINGSKDLQVPPTQNLPKIEAALKEAGNKDFTIKELPELNHLFQHAKTGSPAEYTSITETFSPDALKLVGDWILAHAK